MSREATQQDYKDFYESLTPEQLEIVKQADELFANFLDERDAKRLLMNGIKLDAQKGYHLNRRER